MRGVVLIAILLAPALSGCLSDDEDPKADSTSLTATTTSTADTNTTGPGKAPTANLTADVANGTAPLNVTFTVAGSDADSANLTWTLTVSMAPSGNGTAGNATGNATGNGTAGNATGAPTPIGNGTFRSINGTSATANVTYSFTDAGDYTVVLTVSDGRNNATDRLVIPVAGNATGNVSSGPPQTFTVSWAVGAPGCALVLTAAGDSPYGAARNLEEHTWGKPFTADFATINPDNLGNEMFFYVKGTRQAALTADTEPGVISGIVPEGANLVAFRNCGARGTSVTYTAG